MTRKSSPHPLPEQWHERSIGEICPSTGRRIQKVRAEEDRTVELPKPVTQEVADEFNRLFGRG